MYLGKQKKVNQTQMRQFPKTFPCSIYKKKCDMQEVRNDGNGKTQ